MVLIVALGCGGDDGDASEGSTSSSEAATDTSSSTSTSTSTSSSTTSDASTTTGATDDGSSSVDSSGSTGGAAGCDFEEVVCDAADESKRAPIDCGFVTLADDDVAWQTAYDCFRGAFLDQTAAKLLWENPAVDSTNYSAMVAQVGGVYSLLRFEYDDYMGDIQASVTGCSGITEDPMCMVATGEMCLQCMDPAEPVPICE
jgi:hypothetical protein